MATVTPGDGLFRGILFEGCISGGDTGIQRRPYHRNCGCALHDSRGRRCHHVSRCNSVAYSIRRSWSEGCLALSGGQQSPNWTWSGRPPAAEMPRTPTQLELCTEEDDAEVAWPKV